MTRLLGASLDASDVILMTFIILQDSYMEPTHEGSDVVNVIESKLCISIHLWSGSL